MMIVAGLIGKFGALFVSIPDPIVGGVFMVMFGMIAAVGISNLQFADMNSGRNLFIVGFSIVFGLGLPYYMNNHPNAINTGTSAKKKKVEERVLTVRALDMQFEGPEFQPRPEHVLDHPCK